MESNSQLDLIRQMLENAENSLRGAQKLFAELVGEPVGIPTTKAPRPEVTGGKVVEGVFDGQNMIGPDGKVYSVPANYASKSKLVEGDSLKLTIADDGTFVYKQIGPVERRRAIGLLARDGASGEFIVQLDGKTYKVLRASVTYFKGEEGDNIVVLLPKNADGVWVAVENIIKGGTEMPLDEEASNEEKEKSGEEDSILGVS